MHTSLKIVLLLALFAVSTLADCDACDTQGLQCCDSKCYDPTTASCEINKNGLQILCGFQHLPDQTPDSVCGTACYDTLYYGCCNATDTIYDLKGNGGQFCPSQGGPTSNECSDSQKCTEQGYSCCNGKCYDPTTAGCEVSSNGNYVLCGFQHLPEQIHDGACGTICYDLLYYGCCNDTATIYDLSMASPCGSSPTNAPTNAPTNSPTSSPVVTCGGVTCGEDLSCCNGKCYSTSEAACVTSNEGYQVLCGFQHLPSTLADGACGRTCYDTLGYGCCNSSSVIYQLSQGDAICAGATNLVSCGGMMCGGGYGCCASSCYDVTQFSCATNANNQQMLCNFGDSACGMYCFNANDAMCCNNAIYAIGDSRIPAACGGLGAGNFAGNDDNNNNYNGYNGNGGYYYDASGVFRNCNDNAASMFFVSAAVVMLSVLGIGCV